MVSEIDLNDIANGDVRGTASDAQEMAHEVLRLRARLTKLEVALKSIVASEDDSYGVVTIAREALASSESNGEGDPR